MTCPDCERPMATDANLRSDATPRPEDDLLCWRAFHGDRCQQPIDWRARCKAAEEMAEHLEGEKADLEEQLCRNEIRAAAERGRLREERDRLDVENTALVSQLFETACWADTHAMMGEAHRRNALRFAGEASRRRDELVAQAEATECERELWAIVADSRWEEVWSRDDALEACQKRISGLLDRISSLLSERARLVTHFDAAIDNAPRALTDALSDITRITGERDQAERQVATLQATVLGLLAPRRPLGPAHVDVLHDLWRAAIAQEARVAADEYAPEWAIEESRARVEALGAVLGEEPSDA